MKENTREHEQGGGERRRYGSEEGYHERYFNTRSRRSKQAMMKLNNTDLNLYSIIRNKPEHNVDIPPTMLSCGEDREEQGGILKKDQNHQHQVSVQFRSSP